MIVINWFLCNWEAWQGVQYRLVQLRMRAGRGSQNNLQVFVLVSEMYPVRWNTNKSNGESHASLESFETNFNQVQNNNNNNNKMGQFLIDVKWNPNLSHH